MPTDMLIHVMRQLAAMDLKAVSELSQCNKRWKVIPNEDFWRSMCEALFAEATRTALLSGSVDSFRAFFVKRAQGTTHLPSIHAEKVRRFGELQWTVEVFLAPLSWSSGTVHPLALSQTACFDGMPADGCVSFETSVQLCRLEDYVKEAERDGDGYAKNIWVRWLVRRGDGKATCIYDGPLDEDLDRKAIVADMAGGETVGPLTAFAEGFHSERWYRDPQHGFAHVHPDCGVTLAQDNGWLVAKSVSVSFMLDTQDILIEHRSADDNLVISYLNDHDWKKWK